MNRLTVAYGGMSSDYSAPGDRRRFAGYALRNEIQLVSTSHKGADAVVLTLGADISQWKILKEKHGFLILDIVDAYLDESFFSPKRIFRGMYKSLNGTFSSFNMSYQKLLRDLIRGADVVVCASEEQRIKLLELNSNVYALVDCFDEVLVSQVPLKKPAQDSAILWEGFPANLKHFKLMRSSQTSLVASQRFLVVTSPTYRQPLLIGARQTSSYIHRLGVTGNIIPWTLQNLKDAGDDCKFAVIPIDVRDSMAWKKSENKLLGLWAMGIPTLVSPTPSYTRVVQAAGCNSILVSQNDWFSTWEKIQTDSGFLYESALAGHKYAMENVSSQVLDIKWTSVLRSVVK